MLKIEVNQHFNFNITRNDEQLLINDKHNTACIKALRDNRWHIINELKSFNVEVIMFDKAAKTAIIKVNGNVYNLTAKDQFDVLLDKMGLSDIDTVRINVIKAPMPGLVLKLFVREGMEVKKGDNLFILEAMKMENIIKAPADVFIKKINIKQGDKVEKGQVMLDL